MTLMMMLDAFYQNEQRDGWHSAVGNQWLRTDPYQIYSFDLKESKTTVLHMQNKYDLSINLYSQIHCPV